MSKEEKNTTIWTTFTPQEKCTKFYYYVFKEVYLKKSVNLSSNFTLKKEKDFHNI